MIIVSFSVDCEAANTERGYTDSLVQAAEEANIPLTWLIYVSAKRPMDNARLYHREYFHRIPSWHEIGMHVHFEESGPMLTDSKERGRLIRLGKDVLKQVHVKPTSFRAGSYRLLPSDIEALEEIGILVDSSGVPDTNLEGLDQWKNAPNQPYHPSYESLTVDGEAALLEVPVATYEGEVAYLDYGFEKVKRILEHQVNGAGYLSIGCHDFSDCSDTLRQTVEYLNQFNPRYVTLTQLYSLWKAERGQG